MGGKAAEIPLMDGIAPDLGVSVEPMHLLTNDGPGSRVLAKGQSSLDRVRFEASAARRCSRVRLRRALN